MPKSKSKKANSSLKSWVAFVKKVQKEENISYPEAMKRASARKSEWKRGGSAMSMDTSSPMSSSMSSSSMGMNEPSALPSASTLSNSAMLGGKRRRTKKNRKSKKSRKSRKSRRRKH